MGRNRGAKKKSILLGCVGALLLASTPALANGWSSTLGGDYTYRSASGSDANAVGVNAMVAVPLNWNNIKLQTNGDYHYLWSGGSNINSGSAGGGISAVGGASGGYVGGEVIKYFHPDSSLTAGVDYTSLSGLRATDFSERLEYMAWRNLSVYGGYGFTDVPGAGLHAPTMGLRQYCDGDSPSLIDAQRSAPSAFISTYAATVLTF